MPDPTKPPPPASAGAATSAPADTSGAPAATQQAGVSPEDQARIAEIKATGARLKAEKDQLNKQRQEILTQEKALDQERKDLAEFKKWRAQATTDPDQFLAPIYGKEWRDVLAKATAGDATPLEIRKLREEWEAEKKANAEKEAKATEEKSKLEQQSAAKAKEDEEKAFTEYALDINTRWIKEHEKEFPTIAGTGLGYQIALNVRALHQQGGKVGDKDYKRGDIVDELVVAKDLEEKLDKLLDNVYAIPKWSEKLAQKFKPAAPVGRPNRPQMQYVVAPRKAISQDLSTGSSPKEPPKTREQKKAELLARVRDEQGKKSA